MGTRRRAEAERGDTLIELIISIVILGVAAVGIFSGITLSIQLSDVHRKQTTASIYLRRYAEAIENDVATTGYQASCAPNYPAGFTVLAADRMNTPIVLAVSFWNGSGFPTACSAGTDVGVQQLTLGVSSTDGRASEQLVIIVRKPCGPGSSC